MNVVVSTNRLFYQVVIITILGVMQVNVKYVGRNTKNAINVPRLYYFVKFKNNFVSKKLMY